MFITFRESVFLPFSATIQTLPLQWSSPFCQQIKSTGAINANTCILCSSRDRQSHTIIDGRMRYGKLCKTGGWESPTWFHKDWSSDKLVIRCCYCRSSAKMSSANSVIFVGEQKMGRAALEVLRRVVLRWRIVPHGIASFCFACYCSTMNFNASSSQR